MTKDEQVQQLEVALAEIAPRELASSVLAVGDLSADLWPEERVLVDGWASGRVDEFATGRACARLALRRAGYDSVALLRDADGVPRWPEGIRGSISHSRGIAIAVVGAAQQYTLLGVDLERTDRLKANALGRIVHEREAAFVGEDLERASIVFSLKEAFYKAQYPEFRIAANFKDLALDIDLDAGSGRVLWMDHRFDSKVAACDFAFRIVGDYAVSACWRCATDFYCSR